MDVSSAEGLANHAETLSDYLCDYGANPSERNDNSMSFTLYLLSACWEKLHRRFCSWQRLGLIRKFEECVKILEDHLSIIGKSTGPREDTLLARGPGDRTLLNFLYGNRRDIFTKLLPSILPSDMDPQPSQSVFDKFYEAVIHAHEKDELTLLYTKETALGFHYLVYCVFLMAGRAIKSIKDLSQPLKNTGAKKSPSYIQSVDGFKCHIKAAVLPMKFLQFVLSSTVFKRHIGVWTNDGECIAFLFPSWTEKTNNLIFGKKRHIMAESKMGPLIFGKKRHTMAESKMGPQQEIPIEGGNGTPSESPGKGGNVDVSEESNDDNDNDAPEVCKSIW